MDAETRRDRFVGHSLVVLALLPFLSAVAAGVVETEAQPAEVRADRPALVFDQYLVDLREVPPSDTVYAWFHFRNTGEETVEVTELEPSCGCLRPRLEKRVYEPGESGDFYLRVRTANEDPGPQEYYVTLHYQDPQPRRTRLTFKVVLPEERVSVKPKSLVFYQLNGQSTTQAVTITDHRDGRLELLEATSDSDLAAALIDEPIVQPDGRRKQRVLVRVTGDVPPGRHWASIVVRTSDPTYPEIRVPLLIEGPQDGIRPAGAERVEQTE